MAQEPSGARGEAIGARLVHNDQVTTSARDRFILSANRSRGVHTVDDDSDLALLLCILVATATG